LSAIRPVFYSKGVGVVNDPLDKDVGRVYIFLRTGTGERAGGPEKGKLAAKRGRKAFGSVLVGLPDCGLDRWPSCQVDSGNSLRGGFSSVRKTGRQLGAGQALRNLDRLAVCLLGSLSFMPELRQPHEDIHEDKRGASRVNRRSRWREVLAVLPSTLLFIVAEIRYESRCQTKQDRRIVQPATREERC
jgi:hypothetical protein